MWLQTEDIIYEQSLIHVLHIPVSRNNDVLLPVRKQIVQSFFASAKYNIFYFDCTLYTYFQDINGVSQALAAELFEKGDLILASQDVCEMTPMQLFAITERLKLPLPTCGEFL